MQLCQAGAALESCEVSDDLSRGMKLGELLKVRLVDVSFGLPYCFSYRCCLLLVYKPLRKHSLAGAMPSRIGM